MCFELSEVRDYWCIVSYTKHNDQVLIIQESKDSLEVEMFIDVYGEDLDLDWTDGISSGIYHLALDAVWETDILTKERFIAGAKPTTVTLKMQLEEQEED